MYRKYIDEEVLEQAMQLFWQKGYFNTSMHDLIENTPLNRAAIYKYFNDKQGLFNACLDLYLHKITATAITSLNRTEKNLINLKQFYEQFLEKDHIFRERGCLMMVTISDAPLHGELVNQKITKFTHNLQQLIYSNLVTIKDNRKKKQISSMLVAHTFGLLTLMRCKQTQDILEQQIHGILQVLNNLENQNNE